jgi:cyclophilin family peptidyl-prolyl cis-trans isomerase/HEAT repeat protein
MSVSFLNRLALAALLAPLGAGCATAPPARPIEPQVAYEQKMAWILQLEDNRVLELPASSAAAQPTTAGGARGLAVAPRPAPSLLVMLRDPEARIRRRAALAAGRTRLPEAVPALLPVLAADAEPEVRQMAAFALGLIGEPSAADALVAALNDPDPLVQGRAAEALGLIGHAPAADAIRAMMARHLDAGALQGIAPDDLEYPKASATEAVRLGMYALARLGAYDALAAVLLDPAGQPVSDWWPVAYAFRRVNDLRAGSVLLALLDSQGTYTRAFAARGLGAIKEARALVPLLSIVGSDAQPVIVRIEAARALGELGARQAAEPLMTIITAPSAEPNLRLEALSALGRLRVPAATDLLIDLLTDRWPAMRAEAIGALAGLDPEMFLRVLSGLPADSDWRVRAALATALGTLEGGAGTPRLLRLLADEDQRVVPAVLEALVAAKAEGVESILLERLKADDPAVRMAAARGLARIGAAQAVPALIAAYDDARQDPTYIARTAILEALVALDESAARPVLERALEDADWAVRVRAAQLIEKVAPGVETAARIRPAPPVPIPAINALEELVNPAVSPVAYVETDKGVFQIELAVLDAPRTVANFIDLARRNFFGGTLFHRVVPNFVVQGGDPRGDGHGGPGYAIRDEINQRPYLRGTVGMALDWADTGGSQFFVTHSPQPHLDARYTVFGRVVDGMEVVDSLQQGDRIHAVRVWDGVQWIGGSPSAP